MARLKALVPLALVDTTTLDAVLGRLVGACAREFANGDLEAIAELTVSDLSTGRPWTFGRWR